MDQFQRVFPNSWVEAVALEYVRAHAAEAASAADLARLYLAALQEIRESLK